MMHCRTCWYVRCFAARSQICALCATADGFGAAVRAALGWGMYPEQLAAPSLANGSFVRIADVHLDVPCSGSAGSSTAGWLKR